MKLKPSLLLVAAIYGQAVGLSEARVSTRVFGSGDRLKRLRLGKDALSGNLEDALQWFSDRWPEGAVWPEQVLRPVPGSSTTETRADLPAAGAKPPGEVGPGGAAVSSGRPAVLCPSDPVKPGH